MLLTVDEPLRLHIKNCATLENKHNGCSCYSYHDGYRFVDEVICVGAREKVCYLSVVGDITFLMTKAGKVGGVRLPWWKKYVWRLNTVVIKDIKHWNGEDLFSAIVLLAVFTAAIIGTYCLVKTATASGLVDNCVVREYASSNEYTGPLYILEGHRSWRTDHALLITKVREEAELKKTQICP